MSEETAQGPWSLADIQAFAESRGGSCLSTEGGGRTSPLRFRCAAGHEFESSPFVLIRGGFWCERCMPSLKGPGPFDWSALATDDPTLARFEPNPGKPSEA